MKTQLEFWTFNYNNGKTIYKVYTEDSNIKNELLKLTNCKLSAVYEKGKNVIGYDVLIPSNRIEWIKKKYSTKYLN